MGLALVHVARLVPMVARRPTGVVYLPLSQNGGGFLRDSLIINLSALAGWEVAAHLRGSEFRSLFYDCQGTLMRWWIRLTLRRTASIAVLGESLRPVFDDLVPPSRVVVVPNGTPEFSAGDGDPRDRSHVLFLSNLRRRKGVVEALEAALQVTASRPEARFTFAGDTYDHDLVAELRTRAAPAAGRIVVLPRVERDEKRRLLASAGILLFPPVLPEGHPRVVLEGMAAGMAIVTTARGAIPETVRDGVDGFVLDDPDPAKLAESILRLLDDCNLQERMGSSARQRYLDHFTQEHADERLTRWLAVVADRSHDG